MMGGLPGSLGTAGTTFGTGAAYVGLCRLFSLEVRGRRPLFSLPFIVFFWAMADLLGDSCCVMYLEFAVTVAVFR